MRISVIVPCLDAETTLAECLAAIRLSDHPSFELIVVNDGSTDRSAEIARARADRLLTHDRPMGAGAARLGGSKVASGDLLVFVDSDVIVPPDALTRMETFMSANPDVDVLTGRLSKDHPNTNFASQYKNLYMHFVFGLLPSRVSFVYGSIFCARPGALELAEDIDNLHAEDTALGQRLRSLGRTIAFDRDLQVVHAKRYSIVSLIANDLRVPRDWAAIFLRNKGWRQLGKEGTGFAHASRGQLVSVVAAPSMAALTALSPLGWGLFGGAAAILFAVWFTANLRFLGFLTSERGAWFGARALAFTYLDHLVMASGILLGFVSSAFERANQSA